MFKNILIILFLCQGISTDEVNEIKGNFIKLTNLKYVPAPNGYILEADQSNEPRSCSDVPKKLGLYKLYPDGTNPVLTICKNGKVKTKTCSFNKEGTVTAVSNADAVDYSDWLENQPLACYFKLVKIVGTYSTLLGSLQFVFSAEKISDKLYAGPVIGGVTATEVSWTVPEGEEVVEVILKFGALVDSFKVKTDKGTFSPTFGGGGGWQTKNIDVKSGLYGIFGGVERSHYNNGGLVFNAIGAVTTIKQNRRLISTTVATTTVATTTVATTTGETSTTTGETSTTTGETSTTTGETSTTEKMKTNNGKKG